MVDAQRALRDEERAIRLAGVQQVPAVTNEFVAERGHGGISRGGRHGGDLPREPGADRRGSDGSGGGGGDASPTPARRHARRRTDRGHGGALGAAFVSSQTAYVGALTRPGNWGTFAPPRPTGNVSSPPRWCGRVAGGTRCPKSKTFFAPPSSPASTARARTPRLPACSTASTGSSPAAGSSTRRTRSSRRRATSSTGTATPWPPRRARTRPP